MDGGIKSSESISNLVPALIELSSEIKNVQKTNKNLHFKYTYADLQDYLDVATPELLRSHGLVLVASVVNSRRLKTPKEGKSEKSVEIKLCNRLIHSSGEWIEAYSYGEGVDSGDKAVYKATTGARKYGLALLLTLVTTDDPEKDSQQEKQKSMTPDERYEKSKKLLAYQKNMGGLKIEFETGFVALKGFPELRAKLTEFYNQRKQILENQTGNGTGKE